MKSFFLKPKSVFFPLLFDLVCAAAQRGEQAQHVTCKCWSQLSSLVLNSSLNNWMRRCIHCCHNKEEPRLLTHPSVHLMCWSCQSDDMRTNQSAHCVINHPCSLPALQLVSVQEEEEDWGGGVPATSTSSHPEPLTPSRPSLESPRVVCPKREWQLWSQGLQHPRLTKAALFELLPGQQLWPPNTTAAALPRLPVRAPPRIWTYTALHYRAQLFQIIYMLSFFF